MIARYNALLAVRDHDDFVGAFELQERSGAALQIFDQS